MDALVQTILAELPTTVTTTHLLQNVPRFLQEAQKLVVPGADKKAAVLAALHQLVDGMNQEDSKELKAFVDVSIAPTIDLMVSAYNGTLKVPETIEEVTKQVNCLLHAVGLVVALIKKCRLAKKTKAAPAVAAAAVAEVAAPEVPKEVEVVKVAVGEPEVVKVADAAEVA